MRRFYFAVGSALFLLAAGSKAFTEDLSGKAGESPVSGLITQLSDPDPLSRENATQRLIALGDVARPALRRELSTALPVVRGQIDRVLIHIPWIKEGDDPSVQQAFTGYADLDPESRCERIDSWMKPPGSGASALIRVLLNDPSPAVRWEAADALISIVPDSNDMSHQLIGLVDGSTPAGEAYLPPVQNIPLLAIAGWASQLSSPKRATDWMNRAVKMEQAQPSAFRGQVNFAYVWLVNRATLARDYPRVIDLLRQEAARAAWTPDRVPLAVMDLFAAQADYGPLPGFGDDLRSYREYLLHPEMVYTLARMAQRHGNSLAADTLTDIALLMSGDSVNAHYLAGLFLADRHWNLAAEREYKWALNLSGGKEVAVYFALSNLADDRDDDFASAKYKEIGLQKLTDSNGLSLTNGSSVTADDAWAQVHWHYLRAARDAGDSAGVKLHLDKLMSMDQDIHVLQRAPGMAADIVPALQEQGRKHEADEVFDAAYQALQKIVSDAAEDSMAKNNLAWLCACSGKHLDEAARLAAAAVADNPDDAACLDTQAEVCLKSGQPSKAVQIETHAIELKPDDIYMQKQIARFRKAAAK